MKKGTLPPVAYRDKKPKRVTLEDFNRIIELHKEGISQKDISDKTGRGAGTVCYIIKIYKAGGKFIDRVPIAFMSRESSKMTDMKEVDFAKLPDTELFEYSRNDYL